MERALPGRWRLEVAFGVLLAALAALGARLNRQVVAADRPAVERAIELQQRLIVPLPGRHGNIYGRLCGRWVLMASSRQVPSCFADPAFLRDEKIAETALSAAKALDADAVDIQTELLARRERRFAWLAREISDSQLDAVRKLRLGGVGIQYEWRRHYPNSSLGATVLGFCQRDGAPGGGLELAAARHLAARDGQNVMLADAARRPLQPVVDKSVPPADGGHVFLHLDAAVQQYLEQAVGESVEKYSAKWGAGVVMDPHTGEVLAMCSMPTFDPNVFTQDSSRAELLKESLYNATNRCISEPFEPGSVLKPVFAAAAVNRGLLTYQTKIFGENGTYAARGRGCVSDHGKSYGWLTLEEANIVSSNIIMTKVGEKLGNDELYRVTQEFGFGQATGLGLPGESVGIVRPRRDWDGYSTWRVAFGQEISATPIQLAAAFSALTNGGLLMKPRIVAFKTDAMGKVVWASEPQVVRRVLSPQVSAQTLAVLAAVVERGTGKSCRMDRWTSFGKTGTAQVAVDGAYVDGAYVGTFVGGAPASGPRLIVAISIYWPQKSKGYYGATVAAPYVKQVLEKSLTYLQVPPDKPVNLADARR